MLSRRTAIGEVLSAAAGLMVTRDWNQPTRKIVVLSPHLSGDAPVTIPSNFTGLGYEMSSVATPSLLSPANRRYVELVRGLGSHGVLRVGGIVANYTRYLPDGTPQNERQNTIVTRARLRDFAAFLRETGWSAIWSVNFAQGTIDDAVKEARAVFDALGPKLLALEIGNEVDSYGKGQPFRSGNYDYDTYRMEYREWHAAIAKAIPGMSFAAPDTARAIDWVERMAKDARGEVQLLTTHYYRNGQTRGSAEQLLTPDARLNDILVRLRTVSQQSRIPWRMCEINSFSGGGRPGVSDTFVGALWTLNTMLLLAQFGCAGVNMETGVNQLGFVSSYSPIQDDGKGTNSAGVPYYGMLAFATAFAGCHQLLPLDDGNQSGAVHTYVLGSDNKPRSMVIVNMDSANDAHVSAKTVGKDGAQVLRLLAPSAESTTGVSFGDAKMEETVGWRAKSKERVRNGEVEVPRMSAAVLRFV
jgi:hypothetical protein